MGLHGTKEANADDGESSAKSIPALPHGQVEKALEESSENSGTAEAEKDEYPNGFRLVIITIALCLSVFCMALDNTILSTAIPHITDQFKSLDDIGWYATWLVSVATAAVSIIGVIAIDWRISVKNEPVDTVTA